ncbi:MULTISPECIES: GNAT family N-acetyltransferase [unclassified Amycolatopsis]|uniref:GNAT family N-acetyltransferase n=1 Tax=unclassified Amycolatopsis TaxID=2618356 RepID=UPI001FF44174|nr:MULTISPECIES: GNAT family N-acetyltransferase [unclassified Amycolatopsis]UOZ10621.1 GNAT family N-acetyltransferase [Amycolatopsis sp. WQ 127309]WSJ76916.1 GNAT family N-acetyltransferase [Amycolatopsis sp. NBC_01307]
MDVIRRARATDIEALERLFGAPGGPLATALRDLTSTPHVTLVVAEDGNGVVGTAQLTVMRGLAWDGASRGLLEGIRAARRGVTSALLSWGVDEARRRGCTRLHLDSGLARADLREFYARFGFEHSYQGFTRAL